MNDSFTELFLYSKCKYLKKVYSRYIELYGEENTIVQGQGLSESDKEDFLNNFDKEGNIRENDGVIAFNFRKDRLREIMTAITNKEFNDMDVVKFNKIDFSKLKEV